MHRSHSRRTYPAVKMTPPEVLATRRGVGSDLPWSQIQRAWIKRFHTRKSRGWLKRTTEDAT